ncbi:putative membrane protein [Methylophilaceae bacterium 11]|jgi:putative oxidoreductase|uniref:DoxX family protein n=1 Tax=unclassified Methylotenera TaxID=2643294 RepID=UPI00035FB668|nr:MULTISPECIES: DoxX family protein [unclassified Methylotenera]EUJ11655.1 putative membrane protein [Methylophilaceae bacterium 11]
MQSYQTVIARVLLALVFLGLVLLRLSSITSNPDGYLQYQMTLGQFGLPGIFAPLLILVQLVGGVALLVGFKTKIAARVLAVLALFLAVVLGRMIPEVFFLYLGIAGGMLLLSTYPQTAFSVDNIKK